MTIKALCWAPPCAAATTALLAQGAAGAAWASRAHTLKPGESIAAVARKYHVSVHQIAAANHLHNPDSVRDGTRLTIPPADRNVAASTSIRRTAVLRADRVALRSGPGAEHHRKDLCDSGTRLTVTARRNRWAHVRLADGRTGWIRADFLRAAGAAASTRTASHGVGAQRASSHARRTHTALAASGRRGAHSKRALHAHHRDFGSGEAHASTKHDSRTVRVSREAHRAAHNRAWIRRDVAEANPPASKTDIVRTAYGYRGTPYRYGGSSRGGFDCSGFTSYLYRQQGVHLPHSARAQAQHGHKVERDAMHPGDLVFFHTVTPGISHVGMYVGDGKFVHASSRRHGGVRVDNLNSGYYRNRFRGARRVKSLPEAE